MLPLESCNFTKSDTLPWVFFTFNCTSRKIKRLATSTLAAAKFPDKCDTAYLTNPAGIYLLKLNNRNTRTRCEICSKLTVKTTVFLLLTLNV